MKSLEKRIITALRAYCNNKDAMHVPPRDADIDVVLGDCLKEINELKQKLARYENPDYVLVPREPTKEFIIGLASGCFSEDGSPWLDPEQSYREMLSAIEAVEKEHE